MDFKQKTIMFLGIGVLIVLLFMFFKSNDNDESEQSNTNNDNTYQYSDRNKSDKNEDEETLKNKSEDETSEDDIHVNIAIDLEETEEHDEHDHDYDYDYVKDVIDGKYKDDINEDEIPETSDDIYDKRELEQAKIVAEKFIKAYYNYDGDDTTAGIERAKKHMTKTLYDELILEDGYEENNPRYSSFYKKLTKFKYSKTFVVPEVLRGISDTAIFIRYNVYGEHSNPSNKEKKEVKDVYVLALDKHEDGYLVEAVLINKPLF